MTAAAAAAVNTAFFVHGAAATYTPAATGVAAAVRVVVSRRAEEQAMFDTGLNSVGLAAQVRVSEVAQPARGDTLTVGGVNYLVRTWRPDSLRLVWTLGLEE